MNNKDYAIYNEHFINPKNNIYYRFYNNTNMQNNINDNNINDNIIAHGKQVILVDSDNPWYVNISADKIPAIYKEIDFDKINGYSLNQKRIADFNSVISNKEYPELTRTYSLKERLNKIKTLEGFSNMDYYNYTIYIILIIIIILIIMKYVKNK